MSEELFSEISIWVTGVCLAIVTPRQFAATAMFEHEGDHVDVRACRFARADDRGVYQT